MSTGFITVEVVRDNTETALQRDLKQICNDTQTRYGINEILKDVINKYHVPKDTGALRDSARVVSETEITWRTSYARYQFNGVVYGPNFIVTDEYGNILGWRSPKSPRKKFPTGKSIKYHTPGTSGDWVNAMWNTPNSRRIANLRITNYLKRRVKEMNL